jgi:chromosome partitioning protein
MSVAAATTEPQQLDSLVAYMRGAAEAREKGLWDSLVARLADERLKITIGNLKGGVGKSTSAVYLALMLHALTGKRVLLIDADANSQTVLDWSTQAADWPPGVTVVAWPVTDLARRVKAVEADYGHIVIDTGGHVAAEEILAQALLVTDFLLVPVMASPVEVRRLPATFTLAAKVDAISPVLAQVLLVRVEAGDNDLDARSARVLFDESGMPYMGSYVKQAKRYYRDFGHAEVDPADYLDVLDELTSPDAG